MTTIDAAWLDANPLPEPGADTDKNRRGRVLAVGGSRTVPGGLLLTAEAALRAGAGKVQLGTVETVAIPAGIAMAEAAMFALPENEEGELGRAAAPGIAALLRRCDAAVVGPAMGEKAEAAQILHALLEAPRDAAALILDAAMIVGARDLATETRLWRGRLVMTPHAGEMAGLMGCEESDVTPDLAMQAAERFDAVVVLKRAETCIAAPGKSLLHYPGGGPGLATGGSGDVLAGILAGLVSRGTPPLQAAAWAVWLHGEAGRRLAQRHGRLGLLARELPGEVPALMER